MDNVIQFFRDNPAVWQIGLFPVVTFLITWLFKPRTPEDYAALSPRVAALLKFVAAVGFDAPKIIESISQAVTGEAKTPQEKRNE